MLNSEFFKQLNNIDSSDDDEPQNICLITGNNLTNEHVELDCGHRFNYFELYNEVYNQKRKAHSFGKYRLKPYQVMCPYCRHIENNLLPLPYRLPSGVEKIHGVNYPLKHTKMKNECQLVLKSGPRKGEVCSKLCIDKYCYFHEGYLYKKQLKNNNLCKCQAIIKTGKNKGKQCSRNAVIGDKCKIHNK